MNIIDINQANQSAADKMVEKKEEETAAMDPQQMALQQQMIGDFSNMANSQMIEVLVIFAVKAITNNNPQAKRQVQQILDKFVGQAITDQTAEITTIYEHLTPEQFNDAVPMNTYLSLFSHAMNQVKEGWVKNLGLDHMIIRG